MCIRKKRKSNKVTTGQEIILGQFVYSLNSSHTKNKEGLEELKIELRKMKVAGICSILSEKDTLHTDYGCNSIVDGDERYTLFKEEQLGVDKFTNIEDAILEAGKVISGSCFDEEVDNEDEE